MRSCHDEGFKWTNAIHDRKPVSDAFPRAWSRKGADVAQCRVMSPPNLHSQLAGYSEDTYYREFQEWSRSYTLV